MKQTVVARKVVPMLKQTTSRMPLAIAKRGWKRMPSPQVYLGPLLPAGWRSFFSERRAGAYWGLSIRCPECDAAPPSVLIGDQRWRWLSVHLAKHNGKSKVAVVEKQQ